MRASMIIVSVRLRLSTGSIFLYLLTRLFIEWQLALKPSWDYDPGIRL